MGLPPPLRTLPVFGLGLRVRGWVVGLRVWGWRIQFGNRAYGSGSRNPGLGMEIREW